MTGQREERQGLRLTTRLQLARHTQIFLVGLAARGAQVRRALDPTVPAEQRMDNLVPARRHRFETPTYSCFATREMMARKYLVSTQNGSAQYRVAKHRRKWQLGAGFDIGSQPASRRN